MLFDLICAGIILLLMIWGLFRGLIRQLFGVAGFIGGLVLARLFSAQAATEFAPALGLSPAIATIAFSIAIFFAVGVLASLLGNFLHGHLGVILGSIDKLGGAALGFIFGALVVWALASLMALLHAHLPAAERNVGFIGKLDLAHSQCVQLARDQSFLGDIEQRLRLASHRR